MTLAIVTCAVLFVVALAIETLAVSLFRALGERDDTDSDPAFLYCDECGVNSPCVMQSGSVARCWHCDRELGGTE